MTIGEVLDNVHKTLQTNATLNHDKPTETKIAVLYEVARDLNHETLCRALGIKPEIANRIVMLAMRLVEIEELGIE